VSQTICDEATTFLSRMQNLVKIGKEQFFTDFYQILHAAQKCGRLWMAVLDITPWNKMSAQYALAVNPP